MGDQECQDTYLESIDVELLCAHRERHGVKVFGSLQALESSLIECEATEAYKNNLKKRNNSPKNHDKHERRPNTERKDNGRKPKPAANNWTDKFCKFCESKGSPHARNHNSKDCKRPDNPRNSQETIASLEAKLKRLLAKEKKQEQSALMASDDWDDSGEELSAMEEFSSVQPEPNKPKIHMVVEVKLVNNNGQLVKGLLDLDCTRSAIRSKWVPPNSLDTTTKTKYTNADGKSTWQSHGRVSMALQLMDFCSTRVCEQEFNVTDNLLHDIVFGLDFLTNQEMILDFKKRTVGWEDIQLSMESCNAITTGAKEIMDADYERPNWAAMVPDHLLASQQEELKHLLSEKHQAVEGVIGNLALDPYEIPLKPDAKPVALRAYPIPQVHLAATKREVQRLVDVGVLEPCKDSQWAAPTFIIPKKVGSVRLVSDFRRLNKQINRCPFPLPKIPDIMRSLRRTPF